MLSPRPRLLCSVGTVYYEFHRKGSSPWWGLWLPGHQTLPTAVSLFPVMSRHQWRFWDPLSSQTIVFRTCPGGSEEKGTTPPAQRPCSAPQLRVSCSQHHPESSLQTGETHPPSGSESTCVFLLGDFYLLIANGEIYCALFIKHHFTHFTEEVPE